MSVMVMVMADRRPPILLLALSCLAWLNLVVAMRPDRIAQLRQETVEMFYHGYDNYMNLAFPEDEVWRLASLRIFFVSLLTTLAPPVATTHVRPFDTRPP